MPVPTTADYVRHECGHLIAAKVLGFQTGGIVLESDKLGAQIDLHFSCANISEVSDFLMRRVQVLYAGAIAQTLQGRTIDPTQCRFLFEGPPPNGGTAAHDFAKLKELLRLWIAIRYPNATFDLFKMKLKKADLVLSNAAAKLIISEATIIHDLTNQFMTRYNSFKRTHKKSTRFEMTKAEIDALPSIEQRFSRQGC
jgi:hypothetical protein